MAQTTAFNPTQIALLQMFSINKSQRGLEELRQVLYEHYSKRMDDKLNALWDSGILSDERLDEIATMDLHKLK